MIDREPLKRGANDGRRPEKPVRRNLGAGCSHIPVIARLPIALKRRIVGVDEPGYGECRLQLTARGGGLTEPSRPWDGRSREENHALKAARERPTGQAPAALTVRERLSGRELRLTEGPGVRNLTDKAPIPG